jgi:hypothetical protein
MQKQFFVLLFCVFFSRSVEQSNNNETTFFINLDAKLEQRLQDFLAEALVTIHDELLDHAVKEDKMGDANFQR